jgi:glycosyltransferase involved in cell wall biosynthesis
MRIGIDARLGRREVISGLSRATNNLVEGLLEIDKENDYMLIVKKGEFPRNHFGEKTGVLESDIHQFTARDFFELPKIVENEKIDVMISPQFYMSPFYNCHSVKMVHDLWAILHPEWHPSREDFARLHGQEGLLGVFESTRYFLRIYERGVIFPDNKFVKESIKKLNLESTYLGAIARMVMTLCTADRIVVPSKFVKDQIREYFPEAIEKVEVVSNCLSPIFLSRQTIQNKSNFVFHVSKWESRKNIEAIIEAVKIVREEDKLDLKLVLVGNNDYSEYGRKILKLISRFPYSEFVLSFGTVDDEELLRLYSSAQVFVFPSFNEGFGIPVIEAMATGTPVITSNVSALPEICGNAALFVDPNNVREIAKAITQLLTDTETYQRLAKLGLARAKYFERSKISRSFLTIVEQAIRERTQSLPMGPV